MFLSSRRYDDPPLVITYPVRTQAQAQAMRFPLLFAVPTDDSRDRVSIYQATLLREGPDRWGDTPSVYLVAPYRIFHGHNDEQWPDQAFVRHREAVPSDERANHDILLVADWSIRSFDEERRAPERRALYRGAWRHDASTVFSMYCSSAIPILRFSGHGYLSPWPTAHYNRLPLTRASLDLIRTWVNRWDPRRWAVAGDTYNSSDSEEEAVPVPVPVLLPAPTPRLLPLRSETAPMGAALPAFVVAALIADAVRRTLACPITLEPIAPDTATVTPCYHVFDGDALSVWVSQHIAAGTPPACPTCKAPI
jgi:hypothetical protein